MTSLVPLIIVVSAMLAPYAVVAALAAAFPRLQRGFGLPPTDVDADRIRHELDAIRTRFEDDGSRSSAGVSGRGR